MRKEWIIFLVASIVMSSDPLSQAFGQVLVWDEVGEMNISDGIKPVIPAFEETTVRYKRSGNSLLNILLKKPVLVSVANKEEGWGFFQFPKIAKTNTGKLVAQWNMAKDAVESYGKGGYLRAESSDGGRTWYPVPKTMEPAYGLRLKNDDLLSIYRPKALKVSELNLPAPIDSAEIKKGSFFKFFRLNELPDQLKGVYFYRLPNGSSKWVYEHAILEDVKAVRYAVNDFFPVMWFGDMRATNDGNIYAGIYPGFYEEANGKVKASGILFYCSKDKGKSWKIQGRIPYEPDLKLDINGYKRKVLGFTEPAFEVLKDGSFICIMRTSDGITGFTPMYRARSTDKGVTWSKPVAFTKAGVLPRILQLENGVTVLAAGRPGVQLRFSVDEKGERWTDPVEMLPYDAANIKDAVSCGYPELVATGSNSFLLIYSDFKHKNEKGEIRKAIKVREIIVNKI